jgi:replication factor C subunit 1
MARLRTRALSYEDVKGNRGSAKDADMSPFEAAKRLLEGAVARAPLGEQVSDVFCMWSAV